MVSKFEDKIGDSTRLA